ncbi:MAG: hypothetical protein ACI89L_001801 [Phycisphaerales bacterium]|jgi:hypothetical protein
MKTDKLTEFSIYLDQRPGELAGLLEACRAAGVEVESIVTSEHNERGVVRILGTPVDALRDVCERLVESGVGPVVEADVLTICVEHRLGAIRDIAVAMADNRVNVRYCYLAPTAGPQPARVVMRFDDTDAALAVFDEMDLPANAVSPGPEHAA